MHKFTQLIWNLDTSYIWIPPMTEAGHLYCVWTWLSNNKPCHNLPCHDLPPHYKPPPTISPTIKDEPLAAPSTISPATICPATICPSTISPTIKDEPVSAKKRLCVHHVFLPCALRLLWPPSGCPSGAAGPWDSPHVAWAAFGHRERKHGAPLLFSLHYISV